MYSLNGSHTDRRSINLNGNIRLALGVIILFAIGLYACHCTEMYCFGADDIGEIELLNFSREETDSVFLVFYKKDTQFKVVEDSIMLEIYSYNDSTVFIGESSRKISIDYDYIVNFSIIDKEYEITGFRTVKAECNIDCFPKDYYYKIEGYEINGKYKELSVLQIDQLND